MTIDLPPRKGHSGLKWYRLLVDIDVRSQSWVETLNDSKTINANYDVVAEAEAILANASLVSA